MFLLLLLLLLFVVLLSLSLFLFDLFVLLVFSVTTVLVLLGELPIRQGTQEEENDAVDVSQGGDRSGEAAEGVVVDVQQEHLDLTGGGRGEREAGRCRFFGCFWY